MTIVLGRPTVASLGEVVTALRKWQHDGLPFQLHPGDVGWFWRAGAEATAAALRTWSRDGQLLAVGLLDGADLLRMTTAPHFRRDAELARRVAGDVSEPQRGVLPAGRVAVEAPEGSLVHARLSEVGWQKDEPWTPLLRTLTEPVEAPAVRVKVVGPEQAHLRTAVQRASFESSTFTDDRWAVMAAGLPYAEARCLLAFDADDEPVAAVTVWSAGPGRPGLLEPLGVHRDHRQRGYGTAIVLAAAAALRDMGSSSASVCTPTANAAAIATYRAAGFVPLPERTDRYREA